MGNENIFQIGNKVSMREWDSHEWFEIKFKDVRGQYYGLNQDGECDFWFFDRPQDW